VLDRWALAIADPRVRWLSERAPLRHYIALLGAVVRIWQQRDWIPEHRLARLALNLFGAFVRTERTTGYLLMLPDDLRKRVIEELAATAAPQHAAALAFAALEAATPDDFFEWQPFLTLGLDWKIFSPSSETPNLVASMVDTRTTPGGILDRLTQVATYEDDEHWCRRQQQLLGLEEIELRDSDNPSYPLEVVVAPTLDLITDARMVTLTREALMYEGAAGIRLRAGTDLLAVSLGKPIYGMVRGVELESSQSVYESTLDEMTSEGRAFGSIVTPYSQQTA